MIFEAVVPPDAAPAVVQDIPSVSTSTAGLSLSRPKELSNRASLRRGLTVDYLWSVSPVVVVVEEDAVDPAAEDEQLLKEWLAGPGARPTNADHERWARADADGRLPHRVMKAG